ncbi:hypothetical protein MJO28_011274 [Puccinia striiformis f. sp. tritici]|uniref:Uncharacterized protein n=2 Tax=Puccinia striiformis f. sp. tritici TaxID=168172 RepID=A0ACC0E314_9BASI|nr:hypothetical protein MJO28_011153 [Puccinia striiformis f. sp. tritici]KAI7943746.1 hypothetical protein MJO28_011274 [Puccinia striiformis f. sp. tritici]
MRDTVEELHQKHHGENSFFTASNLFQDNKIDLIAQHADNIDNTKQLGVLIGGEMIEGQLDALMELTTDFQTRPRPAPIPKKTPATSRAAAATQAITNRINKPSAPRAPGEVTRRKSTRIGLP